MKNIPIAIKCLFLIALQSLPIIKINAQSLKAPTALRVDLLLQENGAKGINSPILTANREPYFTWQMDDSVENNYQTAYRILVAYTAENLKANKADVWDSGKILNDWLPGVPYKGPKLLPNTSYHWKVMIWNNRNLATEFSIPAVFKTALVLEEYQTSFQPLVKTIHAPENINKLNNKNIIYDFGKDAFGQLSLTATSESGMDTLKVHFGEMRDRTGHIERRPPGAIRYRLLYVPLNKGIHQYDLKFAADSRNIGANAIKMPNYIGEVLPFRYVEIEKTAEGTELQKVVRSVVNYPFNDKASLFKSSDSILNQVWDISKYTIKATSFTGLYVDGDRERIPYEADVLINQLSHYAVDPEFSMAKRTLEFLIYHPTWPTEWSLQNLIVAWNDYLYSGDVRTVRALYPQLKPKLLMALAGENGLISTRTGKQDSSFIKSIHFATFNGNTGLKDIVDWPQKGGVGLMPNDRGETDGFVFTDYNAVVNAFYYKALLSMREIAIALNERKDADLYALMAAKVKLAFQETFINSAVLTVRDGDATDHSSLHANMFALAFNLIPEKNKIAVLNHMRSRGMACSVYGAQFLLDGLYNSYESEYALQLLTATGKRSWYNMLRSGSTMTTEAWDTKYKGNQDWNHAWGAAPANIIVRKLMGFEPLSPGFKTIQIRPQPGSLKTAELELLTLPGKVRIAFQKGASRFSLQTTIPPNVTAMVYLPKRSSKDRVMKNGKVINAIADGNFWKIVDVKSGVFSWEVDF